MSIQHVIALPLLVAMLACANAGTAGPLGSTPTLSAQPQAVAGGNVDELKRLYKQLIDAENRHDLDAVRPMLWTSPSMLFVAKTATPAEGNWAGFWGTEVVMQHLRDLYQGPFLMDPDYEREKVVFLTTEVAETYAPLKISVAYAGQTPVPKPFLMIVEWIRTPEGWRMATDIALPVPPATIVHE
jgi:hypothetical protein